MLILLGAWQNPRHCLGMQAPLFAHTHICKSPLTMLKYADVTILRTRKEQGWRRAHLSGGACVDGGLRVCACMCARTPAEPQICEGQGKQGRIKMCGDNMTVFQYWVEKLEPNLKLGSWGGAVGQAVDSWQGC